MKMHTELVETCVDRKMIFPSIEAFAGGIRNIPVYIVFYDMFLKASVGEQKFKKLCSQNDDPSKRIGMTQDEAFALIALKNNYFAWLMEAKAVHGQDLVTDYDYADEDDIHLQEKQRMTEAERDAEILRQMDYREVADVVMPNLAFDLEAVEGEESDGLIRQMEETIVIRSSRENEGGDRRERYEELVKNSKKEAKTARSIARWNENYKRILEVVNDENGDDDGKKCFKLGMGGNAEEVKERNRKRRKILKEFKEYTVPRGQEGRFKGWSKRAAHDLAEVTRRLRNETSQNRYKRFRVAYRAWFRMKNRKENGRDNENGRDGGNEVNMQVESNCNVFRDVPECVIEEI